MTDQWQYQIRITLSDENAKLVRFGHLSYFWFKPIVDILSKHNATLVCQFDAFSDYVAEAEEHGVDEYPLKQLKTQLKKRNILSLFHFMLMVKWFTRKQKLML